MVTIFGYDYKHQIIYHSIPRCSLPRSFLQPMLLPFLSHTLSPTLSSVSSLSVFLSLPLIPVLFLPFVLTYKSGYFWQWSSLNKLILPSQCLPHFGCWHNIAHWNFLLPQNNNTNACPGYWVILVSAVWKEEKTMLRLK